MGDFTFGAIGDYKSYHPIERSEVRSTSRGDVNIMRIGLGTDYNKLYQPFGSGLTGNRSSKYLSPNGNDFVKLTKTGDFSDTLNSVGYNRHDFVYLSYLGDDAQSASNVVGHFGRVNHDVKVDLGKDFAGVDGMRMIWDIDFPTLSALHSDGAEKCTAFWTLYDKDVPGNKVEIYAFPDIFVGDVMGFNVRMYRNGSKVYQYTSVGVYLNALKNTAGLSMDNAESLTGRDYNRTQYNTSGNGSTNNNYKRTITWFAFDYNKNHECSLWATNYVNRAYVTTGIWNGRVPFSLDRFGVEYRVVSKHPKFTYNPARPIEVRTGYFRALYPNMYNLYGLNSYSDINNASVKIYDDNNSGTFSNWDQIISRDKKLNGRLVIDNGLLRVIIGKVVNDVQVISVHRLVENSVATGKEVFTITPVDDMGGRMRDLTSLIFKNLTANQVVVNLKYRNVEYDVSLARGMPYCNIDSNVAKVMIHRDAVSNAVYSGSTTYVESMVVPAFTGDYTRVIPDGTTSTSNWYNQFYSGFRSNNMSSNGTLVYILSDLKPINDMFDNYIIWGVNHGTSSSDSYGNIMCFARRPISIERTYSVLSGNGDYPSSNFIQSTVTFKTPFSIALVDINGDFMKDSDNIKKFIRLTNEANQLVYEKNFIRRKG